MQLASLERGFVVVRGWRWCGRFLVFDGWADRGWGCGVDVAGGHGPYERAGLGLFQMGECAVEGVFEDVMAFAERAEVAVAGCPSGWRLEWSRSQSSAGRSQVLNRQVPSRS